MKRSSLIAFLLVFCQLINGQTENKFGSPLSIGEPMPDIAISNIDNYPKSELKFSELRGKLVILDFWATNCRGCILQFPKLDSLQRKFGDRVQIILVNKQTKKQVEENFLNKKSIDTLFRNVGLNLPSITSDSLLQELFPHVMIPHEVWIDTNGKVMSITDERSVTEKTIRNIFDGYFDLPVKKDLLTYNPMGALLPQVIDSNKSRLEFYSCLIRGVDGLRPSPKYVIDSARKILTVTRTTMPILKLYAEALSKGAGFDYPYEDAFFDYGKRIILKVKDSCRFFYDSSVRYDIWQKQNCYAYEMVLPLEQRNNLYSYMLSDLNRFFDITGRVEKRKMKCLVIVRINKEEKFKYNGPTNYQGPRHWSDMSGVFHFRSTSFTVFRKKLSDYNRNHPLPFLDDTGYTKLIQMDLESPLNDIPLLRLELQKKYGLDIVEKVSEVDVMMLTANEYKK
jgi:thiol-disulfide isomerase/thioredoxin